MNDLTSMLTNPVLNWSLFAIINTMMLGNVIVGTLHAKLKGDFKRWYFKEHIRKKVIYSLLLLVILIVAHDNQSHALGSVLTGYFIRIEWGSFKKHFIEYKGDKK